MTLIVPFVCAFLQGKGKMERVSSGFKSLDSDKDSL